MFDVLIQAIGNNMCGNKSSFFNINFDFHFIVSFGNFSIVNMIGKKDTKIKTKNDFVKAISNVLYVHNFKSNFLSANQL